MVVFVINILIVQVDILNYVLHIVLFVSSPSVSNLYHPSRSTVTTKSNFTIQITLTLYSKYYECYTIPAKLYVVIKYNFIKLRIPT